MDNNGYDTNKGPMLKSVGPDQWIKKGVRDLPGPHAFRFLDCLLSEAGYLLAGFRRSRIRATIEATDPSTEMTEVTKPRTCIASMRLHYCPLQDRGSLQ
mgnify:CR=1 FL=1